MPRSGFHYMFHTHHQIQLSSRPAVLVGKHQAHMTAKKSVQSFAQLSESGPEVLVLPEELAKRHTLLQPRRTSPYPHFYFI